MRKMLVLPLVAGATLAAAQPMPPVGPPEESGPARPRGGGVFISPMGEPFRGEGRPEAQIRSWFDAADADHDGAVTLAEMEADAARFYATLEVNHDGEIDPAEMERYETQVAPEIHQLGVMAGLSYSPSGSKMPWRGPKRGGHGAARRAARAFSLLNLPQPVASADFNFNRGISPAEFKQAAGQRFALLDGNHDGRLEMAELAAFRPTRPPLPAMDQGKDDED